jgi:hypothetical protein
MCGDLDEGIQIDEEIYSRFLRFAKHYSISPGGTDQRKVVALAKESSPAPYMDALFADFLQQVVNDTAEMPEGMHADAIANQVIVLSRLAGFLAGQFPPATDLYRGALEAFSDGYAEPTRLHKSMSDHHGHSHDHHQAGEHQHHHG